MAACKPADQGICYPKDKGIILQKELQEVLAEAAKVISAAQNPNDIMNARAQFLGKKSFLSTLYTRMRELPAEERPAFGASINEVRSDIETRLSAQEKAIKENAWKSQADGPKLDLSLPGIHSERGGLHPLSVVTREIESIFMSMGFEIARGNDIEDEYHNFDALNTPPDHPSRNLADTFYLDNGMLLRTQTSTVQIRTMENHQPPIRIISPGRCYRNDKPDPSHSPVFHQVEALVVDRGISMSDLTDTLQNFASLMFGKGVRTRIRPHFFPFTEPSAEMDISCVVCAGKGCRMCKNSGWLEMGGAGMIDPNVLDIVGIDSEIFTGYAFGLGIERIALLKYNIPDMRILFENDIRMLVQFRGASL